MRWKDSVGDELRYNLGRRKAKMEIPVKRPNPWSRFADISSIATHLLAAEADLAFVQHWLGPKDIQHTTIDAQLTTPMLRRGFMLGQHSCLLNGGAFSS
jgi:hypothetical protein